MAAVRSIHTSVFLRRPFFDRMQLASKPKLVRHAWVEACVSEGRRVDEGQYSVTALHVPLVERLQKKNTPTSGQQGRERSRDQRVLGLPSSAFDAPCISHCSTVLTVLSIVLIVRDTN